MVARTFTSSLLLKGKKSLDALFLSHLLSVSNPSSPPPLHYFLRKKSFEKIFLSSNLCPPRKSPTHFSIQRDSPYSATPRTTRMILSFFNLYSAHLSKYLVHLSKYLRHIYKYPSHFCFRNFYSFSSITSIFLCNSCDIYLFFI
jgi:hypothetical protein